jgi:F-type H+-transporting ATPase subunit a
MLTSLIILFIIINLINLLPFSFCFNSQIYYLFFFSLIFWFSCLSISIFHFFKNTLSHFTPIGCPIILRPLIVLIELIRLFIRPITLRVRISANLLAGHLLIHLLTEFSFFLYNLNNLTLIISLAALIILNLLEIGVSIIQAYIFFTLINMYLCENI